ncbi:MAG: SpoIID/LytB domain-containing protein [Planctomycetota bacterium]
MCSTRYLHSALLFCLLLFPAGCGRRQEPLPVEIEPAGIEVRIRIFSAPRVLFRMDGAVQVKSIEDGRVLYSGEQGTVEAGCEGPLVRIAGRVFDEAVRIERLVAGPQAQDTVVSADPPAGQPGAGDVPVLLHRRGADFTLSAERGGGNARSYRGALELKVVQGTLEAVNAVDLEHYLLGVVGAEMPAYFDGEALAAQAVASRTFALYSLRRALEAGRSPVFRANTGFQVYKGVAAETRSIRKAVAKTRGQALHWRGGLFSSYFHSTCGGRTANVSDAIGDAALQPLSGVVCGGCDNSQFSSWRSVLRAEELESLARAYLARTQPGLRMGRLEGIEVSERAADGRVLYLRLVHSLGSFEWWAYSFRMAVEARVPGTVLSTSFSLVRQEAGEWVLAGAGWGHGVGLCQVGARGLVKQGLDYRQILLHYYSGSELAEAY